MKNITEQKILGDFVNKHNFSITDMNKEVLKALIRYSRLIGFAEGFKEAKEMFKGAKNE